jgi:hypothetical protein
VGFGVETRRLGQYLRRSFYYFRENSGEFGSKMAILRRRYFGNMGSRAQLWFVAITDSKNKTHIHVLHIFMCIIKSSAKYVTSQKRSFMPATTVNFTGAVDRTLLRRAKVIAAQNDTSINALFNAELRYLVETFDAAQATGNQNYPNLLAFALGQRDAHTTMEKLGIDSAEDLFLLMAHAHLPMPRIADAATDAMVQSLHALPSN